MIERLSVTADQRYFQAKLALRSQHGLGIQLGEQEIQPRQISDAMRVGTLPRLAADRPVMIDACAAIARATGTHACASAVTREAKSLPGQ